MSTFGIDHSDYEKHDTKPLTVTVPTAKRLSGLGNTTIWALIKNGTLEVVRVGGRTLITFRSLEALLTALLTPPAQPRRRGRPRKVPANEATA